MPFVLETSGDPVQNRFVFLTTRGVSMKKFTMWLMVALLAVAPIGCGPGTAGSSGDNPSGDGTTVGEDEVKTPAGEKAKSNKNILDEMGPGGPADPDGAAAAAPAPADAKKK